MDILLDSNIWRYVADASAAGSLQAMAARGGNRVVIAPAVLYEALRLKDPALRKILAEVMTRKAWRRLMPDAYEDAVDVIAEVTRLRTHWLRERPDTTLFRRLRSDWRKIDGGFWSRARTSPEREHQFIAALDGPTVDAARENAKRQRAGITDKDRYVLDKPLQLIVGQPAENIEEWDGRPVEMWRLSARSFLLSALRDNRSAHFEWIAGHVDVPIALSRMSDWNQFWLYEVQPDKVPGLWLRSAMEFMQAFFKVTDGTPVDSQIGSYASSVDLIVSSDKRFVEMCQRCSREAPFFAAEAVLLPAGLRGVEELLHILSTKRSSRRARIL